MRKSLSVFALTGFFYWFRAQKAAIQQKHYAPVLLRANDPARRLQHLVHARKAVGVVETGAT